MISGEDKVAAPAMHKEEASVACETHLSRVECVTVGRSGRLSGFVVVRPAAIPINRSRAA
jgi:hypothetical protein